MVCFAWCLISYSPCFTQSLAAHLLERPAVDSWIATNLCLCVFNNADTNLCCWLGQENVNFLPHATVNDGQNLKWRDLNCNIYNDLPYSGSIFFQLASIALYIQQFVYVLRLCSLAVGFYCTDISQCTVNRTLKMAIIVSMYCSVSIYSI